MCSAVQLCGQEKQPHVQYTDGNLSLALHDAEDQVAGHLLGSLVEFPQSTVQGLYAARPVLSLGSVGPTCQGH